MKRTGWNYRKVLIWRNTGFIIIGSIICLIDHRNYPPFGSDKVEKLYNNLLDFKKRHVMTEESKIRDAADAVKGIVQSIPVYQDGLQPAVRQVGIALEKVAKTIYIVLAPISAFVWGYEQVKGFVSTRVAEKLKNVPPERIVTPCPQVAVPVLEALRYTGHEEQLRELYANLLATSLDSDTTRNAHPAFVEIIKSMSPDEARILRLFSSVRSMPLIDVLGGIKSTFDYIAVRINHSNIGKEAGCDYPELTPAYLDNLCRLGLLQIPPGIFLCNDDYYKVGLRHETQQIQVENRQSTHSHFVKWDFVVSLVERLKWIEKPEQGGTRLSRVD